MPTHTKRVPLGGRDAATLYRRLREHVPTRTSLLFEGVELLGRRLSIVAYLARSEGAFGVGIDAITCLAHSGAALAADGVPEGDALERLAARLSFGAFGFASASSGLAANGIAPWPDDPRPGREASNLTVGVVDEAAGELVIAGRSPNVCERLAWESANPKSPEPPPPPEGAAASPPAWIVPDKDQSKALGRLLLRMEMAELQGLHVHLARLVPAPGADPFVAYRALRAAGGAERLFFLDLAAAPSAPGFVVLGRFTGVVAADEGTAFATDLAAALPPAHLVGAPPEQRLACARIVREYEPASRGLYGGAAGVVLPGGGGFLGTIEAALTFDAGVFELHAGVDIRDGDDLASVRARASEAAPELLRAALAAAAGA